MIDLSKLNLPKGGSATAPPTTKPAEVYVEPWKPWGGRPYVGFEQWYEWMCYDRSHTDLLKKLSVQDAIFLYQTMNSMVYDIQRKIDETTKKPTVSACTCHERDSSQVCNHCYAQGLRGHMQE